MHRLLAVLALAAGVLSAQSSITGTLVGTVTDSSGATIAGAKVAVTNEGTGITVQTVTTATGDYSVPNLYSGSYRVQAVHTGFGPVAIQGISLLLNQTVRTDIVLKPGALDQTVSVVDSAPAVQSETSSVASVMDSHAMQNLPVNGRTTSTFIMVSPGNAGDWASNPKIGGAQHWGGSKFSVDGVQTDDLGNGGGTYSYATSLATQPSIETIDELKIESNSAKAEYSGSVAVSMVTKRGSNTVHGSLFAFNRNAALAANQFFNNSIGRARQPYNRNEFGGSVGGPVIKNHTFFFGAFEGMTVRSSNPGTFSVPVASLREGIFPSTVRDPLNGGTPFPDNIIPSTRIDPRSKQMLSFIPLPNGAGNFSNFREALLARLGVKRYSARVDHNFNASNMLAVSLAYGTTGPYSTNLYSPNAYGNYSNAGFRTKTATIAYTRVLSPTMTNEVRASYFTMVNIRIGQNQDFNPSSIFSGLYSPIPMGGLPTFNMTGYTKVGDVGGAQPNPQITNTIGDTFSWVKGNHIVKAGVDASFGRISTNPSVSAAVLGTFNFLARYTGNVIGDVLLGYPSTATRATATPSSVVGQQRYGFYVQDDWKVNRYLTLNYGMRYELQTQFTERSGTWSNFDFATGQLAVRTENGQYPSTALNPLLAAYPTVKSESIGWGSDVLLPDHKNFAPRFGIAFRPFGGNRSVIRAGYGIFYNLIPVYQGIYQLGISNPPYRLAESFSSGATTPTISLANPFAVTPTVSANPVIYAVDRQIRNPYSQQWNFSIEQALAGDIGLRVTYLGNKGNRVLYVNSDANLPMTQQAGVLQSLRPYQPWSNIYTTSPTGNMMTHQMQIEATRRFKNGFFFQSSFNWTKTLDNVAITGTPQNPYNTALERGNSEGIRRYTFFTTASYELPFGRGHRLSGGSNRVLSELASGWRLGTVLQLRSGAPFSVTYSTALAGMYANRADVVSSDFYPAEQTIARWFNPSAFAAPAPFTFGNSQRNMLFGPGQKSLDFSVNKITTIHERMKLEFRAEAFNLPNTPSFGQPATDVAVPATLGTITTTTIDARTIQFGLKLLF